MSACELTLTANAGAVLALGRIRLWVDALHDQKVPGFSTVTPALLAAMSGRPEFAEPSLLFFTHCHPDHCSPSLAQAVLDRWPNARAALPEAVLPEQLLLSGRRERLTLPELTLDFIRLPHEGAQYAHVPHYGCIADYRGYRILIPGDCALAAPELAEFLAAGGPIDLALLDFPWITLRRGRQFVREVIRPRSLAVFHLPFAVDDVNGYRRAAVRAAGALRGIDVRVLLEPFQQESFQREA